MICKNCGKELIDGAKFCVGCGTPVEEAPAVNNNVQPAVETGFAEPVAHVEPVAPVSPVEPVAPVYQAPQQPAAPVYEAPQQNVYGAPQQPATPMYQAPQQQYIPPVNSPLNAPVPAEISEDEFFERFADKNLKTNYKVTMIISFLSAVIAIPAIVFGNVFSIIDLIAFAVIGGLMLKKKTWILPLAMAIWGGIGTVLSMATTGTPTGIVALIFAISATIGAKKVHDAYVQFKSTGVAPTGLIGSKK